MDRLVWFKGWGTLKDTIGLTNEMDVPVLCTCSKALSVHFWQSSRVNSTSSLMWSALRSSQFLTSLVRTSSVSNVRVTLKKQAKGNSEMHGTERGRYKFSPKDKTSVRKFPFPAPPPTKKKSSSKGHSTKQFVRIIHQGPSLPRNNEGNL